MAANGHQMHSHSHVLRRRQIYTTSALLPLVWLVAMLPSSYCNDHQLHLSSYGMAWPGEYTVQELITSPDPHNIHLYPLMHLENIWSNQTPPLPHNRGSFLLPSCQPNCSAIKVFIAAQANGTCSSAIPCTHLNVKVRAEERRNYLCHQHL